MCSINKKQTDGRQKKPVISPTTTGNPIKATIQLDRLEFTCVSTVFDNFDYVARGANAPKTFIFNETQLNQTTDKKGMYKYSYQVFHKGEYVALLKFGSRIPEYAHYIKVKIANKVFYNDTLKEIPDVLDNLNLEIIFFSEIDIAVDSHNIDFERFIVRNIRTKDNIVKLKNRTEKDRNKTLTSIMYFSQGSLNNQYKARSVTITTGKRMKLCVYNKKEEIENASHKSYILDYHKRYNPKLNKLYRLEIRLMYDELLRYSKKCKISFNHLLNPSCLHVLVLKYLDRFIVFRKNGVEIPIIPIDLQYYNTV